MDVVKWFLHLRAHGWVASLCHRATKNGNKYTIEVWNGAKWFPIGTYVGIDAAIKYFVRASVTQSSAYKPCGLELLPLPPMDDLILRLAEGEAPLIDALLDVLERGS